MKTQVSLALLLLLAAACSGSDGDTVAVPLVPYEAPADRIDPVAARDFDDAAFRMLGQARVERRRALPTTGEARYVSAALGDDGADGSKASPWKTLQHAVDEVSPGTTIWVDASGDYAGGLEISSSGEEGAFIVVAGDPSGPRPRITGAADATSIVDISASWIVFAGFELAHHQRGSLEDDTIGIEIEARDEDLDHVFVFDNVIHDIGPGVIDQAECYYNGHGIIAQAEGRKISGLWIDGNELYDLYVGHSEVVVVNGNVDGFRITNNYVHDVNNIAIDIIGYEKNSTETARNGLVADNIVLDASNYWPYCSRGNCTYPAGDESSDGIYVDGGADLIIEFNVVGRADHGIELQSENGELIRNTEVRFNVVFNSNYKNFTLGDAEGSSEHDNVFFDDPRLEDPQFATCRE